MSGPQELVLEAAVSHQVDAGTKLQSSARAVSALNHQAHTSDPTYDTRLLVTVLCEISGAYSFSLTVAFCDQLLPVFIPSSTFQLPFYSASNQFKLFTFHIKVK